MKIKRLTTDTPKNNSERLMNFAYSKDGEIYVLWHNGVKDVNINDIVRKLADYGDYSNILDGVEDEDIFETLIENGDSLWATTMLMLATQAAELRDRLKMYEDAEEKGRFATLPQIGDMLVVDTSTLPTHNMNFGTYTIPRFVNAKVISYRQNKHGSYIKLRVAAEYRHPYDDKFEPGYKDFSYPISAIGKTVFYTHGDAVIAYAENEQKKRKDGGGNE